MRIPDGNPAFARGAAAAALATLAVMTPVGASRLGAQRPQSGGAQVAPGAPSPSRLPRLLDGGAAPVGRPGAQARRSGWGAPTQDGWWSGRPVDATEHEGARRRPRRVQPLVVFVSPYASVYATSSSGGCGWIGAASCTAPSAPVDVDSTARRAVRTKVIEVTPAASAAPATSAARAEATLAVDWLRDDVLRLRWSGGDPTVRAVELVVADSARRVLASQRVHEAPYTAVFARDARTSLVGVSVLRTDGTSTLSLTPLGMRPAPRD